MLIRTLVLWCLLLAGFGVHAEPASNNAYDAIAEPEQHFIVLDEQYAQMAEKGRAGETLKPASADVPPFAQMYRDWVEGTFGKLLIGLLIVTGLVVGLTRISLAAFVVGIGGGIFLYASPGIVDTFATDPTVTTGSVIMFLIVLAGFAAAIAGAMASESNQAETFPERTLPELTLPERFGQGAPTDGPTELDTLRGEPANPEPPAKSTQDCDPPPIRRVFLD